MPDANESNESEARRIRRDRYRDNISLGSPEPLNDCDMQAIECHNIQKKTGVKPKRSWNGNWQNEDGTRVDE